MNIDQPEGQEGMQLIRRTLGDPLGQGELGALMAAAGVGKTACLTHIALENLFEGQPVLHVCIDGAAEKIKIWYRGIAQEPSRFPSPRDEFAALQRRLEAHRFILAYLHQAFRIQKLEQSLQNLEEQTKFHPALVVLDGLDFDREPRATVAELRVCAETPGFHVDVHKNPSPYCHHQ